MFRDLKIESGYATNINNIGLQFYTPILNKSIHFKRVAGYFNSKAFLFYSNGLEGLIKNNGKYDLIISAQVSEEDYNHIKNGYRLRENLIERVNNVIEGFDDFENIGKSKICNLAYLIETGYVDIKIGFTKEGLFHAKYGIFEDKFGNQIYFTGSLNETSNAFKDNYEEITVLKNWNNRLDEKHIEKMEKQFDRLWSNNNNDGMLFVLEANELIKRNIMKYSKGEIILDSSILSENSLILYYDKKLRLKNNLKSFPENNSIIKRIKNKYLIDKSTWEFKNFLTKDEIIKIIDDFNKYKKRYLIEKNKGNFVISDSVYNYLNQLSFDIQEIYKRGMLIKVKDDSLRESYEIFSNVVSNEVNRELRLAQSWVSYYMTLMKRVSNFSVPGSGKTSMVYGSYAYLSSHDVNEIDRIVVICPKSAFMSWIDEFHEVFGDKRKLKVLNIHDKDFDESMLYKNLNQYNLFLFNYEAVIKYKKVLLNIINKRTIIVFDEVHKIKKINSERAQICINVAQGAKYRFCLTGTPIPNKYVDIWNFLQILYRDEYKQYFNFNKMMLKSPSYLEIESINEKINPFFWRITKDDLDVPKVEPDKVLIYNASSDEQFLINRLWSKYKNTPFKLYIRLLQLTSNPSLLRKNIEREIFAQYDYDDVENQFINSISDIPSFDEDEIEAIDRIKKSSKFSGCINLVNQLVLENKKLIVWCIFVDTIQKLSNELYKQGHNVAIIYGGMDLNQRNKIIKEYNDGMYDVLITNPHTMAESVSLHKVCHDAIYLEYSFNLTHMLQSRDRIHRLGLKSEDITNYYYLVLRGDDQERDTIDYKIYDRLKEKEEVMLKAIEGKNIVPQFDFDEEEEIINLINEEIMKS